MDIKYVDYFITDNKKHVKNIYYNSFNKLERFPFWLLKKCAKENNIEFNAILNNSTIIGVEYVVKYDNVAYLIYLAHLQLIYVLFLTDYIYIVAFLIQSV